jgi:hypothetical protein
VTPTLSIKYRESDRVECNAQNMILPKTAKLARMEAARAAVL